MSLCDNCFRKDNDPCLNCPRQQRARELLIMRGERVEITECNEQIPFSK